MIEVIHEMTKEIQSKAIRRQKFIDALFWTGIFILLLTSLTIILFMFFELLPFDLKEVIHIGR